MGFFICYKRSSNEVTELKSVLNERVIPSPINYSDDRKSMYVGEIFDCTSKDIFVSNWKIEPNILNSFMAAGYAIHFDDSECIFATDNTGRELLYYYFSKEYFILSDSFWDIVKEIDPKIEDIDSHIVKEMIASGTGVPCDHSTLIKNLYWAEPNLKCKFDPISWEITLEKYKDIRRSGSVYDMDEAVKQMDRAMIKMVQLLSEKFPKETFGLGLSGGLDSRIALYYLQQSKNKLECFNVCTKRPRKILLAKSVKNARKLAKHKCASYCEVEWNIKTLRSKFDRMMEFQPLGTCGHFTNAYKYETEGMPDYDVLITAGQGIGPYLVGVSASDGSDNLTREEIIGYLMNLEIENAPAYRFTIQSIRRILSNGGLKFIDVKKGRGYKCWAKYADDGTYNRIRDKVEAFVDSRLQKGYRPADITLDFRTSALGAIGRNGAYESVLCLYRNFTIYTPFLVKCGLNWDISLIENRKILKELIKQKMPEFESVGEEEVGASNFKSPLMKFIRRIEFLLRGSGIKADEWYSNNAEVRKLFFEDFANGCIWFDLICNVKSEPGEIWKLSPGRKNSIWEIKRLIDSNFPH